MRIVNFNRQIKENGDWLNTWIDWNKTYCQDLHNKITSLYDYVMYNYPQYLIFNSPNKLHEKDSFVSFASLIDNIKEPRLMAPYEKEVSLVVQNEGTPVSQTKSFFLPCLLNYHQGFYNQSQYGDGCLVIDYSDLLYLDLQQKLTNTISSMCHIWSYNGDDDTWGETKIEIPSNQPNDYFFVGIDQVSFQIDNFYPENTPYLSWSNNTVTFNSTQAKSEKWKYFLLYKYANLELNCEETISYIFKNNTYYPYKSYIIPANTVFKLELENILYFIDFDNTSVLFDTEKDSQSKLFNYAILGSGKSTELISDRPFFKCNKKLLVVTKNLQVQYNFPSGYLCLLNKQVIGENNPQNSIKHQWSSYFITPIGNGGYFDINWLGGDLVAEYYANELNNFTNNISINLAQNCRYINPDLIAYKLVDYTMDIPNRLVSVESVTSNIADKYGNIWTGQNDIVGQLLYRGDYVLADVDTNIYHTATNNNKIFYFNTTTKQQISLKPEIWIY